MNVLNVGFLASGEGTNMQAVIDACKNGELQMKPVAVVSDKSESGALRRARWEGISPYCINNNNSEDADLSIRNALIRHRVNLALCLGYLKKVGPKTLEMFEGCVLNIHPSLLPQYGGKGMYGIKVHQAVLQAHERQTGVTIHVVNPQYDRGSIIAQASVEVFPNDTPETLQKRVLEFEHRLLVKTLLRIEKGEIPFPFV